MTNLGCFRQSSPGLHNMAALQIVSEHITCMLSVCCHAHATSKCCLSHLSSELKQLHAMGYELQSSHCMCSFLTSYFPTVISCIQVSNFCAFVLHCKNVCFLNNDCLRASLTLKKNVSKFCFRVKKEFPGNSEMAITHFCLFALCLCAKQCSQH